MNQRQVENKLGKVCVQRYPWRVPKFKTILVRDGNAKGFERPFLRNAEGAVRLLSEYLKDADREKVVLVMLDVQNRITGLVDLFSGTLDQCQVYSREILKTAILGNAAAIVLAHNHPSGKIHPSRDDEVLTITVQNACSQVGVKLLDHIIVGEDGHYSFREAGGLK